jgi:hypothetical protein
MPDGAFAVLSGKAVSRLAVSSLVSLVPVRTGLQTRPHVFIKRTRCKI